MFLSPACSDHSSGDNQLTRGSVTCVREFMDLHWDVVITSAKEISVCYFLVDHIQ